MADENIFVLPSADQFDELNSHLVGLYEAKVGKSIKASSWAQVQNYVRRGFARKIFAIGDQLSCQKGNKTLVWDVIGIDHDTPTDPQFTHSLTLCLHECYDNVQFDAPEAFYYAENGLAAGTYYFTIDNSYDATYNSFKDAGYQFTLTQAVPAGGQLIFPWGYQKQASTIEVSSYLSSNSATAIDSVSVSSGTSGTFLGNLTIAGDFSNNLNSIQRIRYGSNNYKESAIRQWLNSDKAAGSVWAPQTKFDRPPSWASSTAGFVNGLDEDFLNVIGKTHLIVSRNTVTDNGGQDELNDKFFLLSRREVYAENEVSNVIEGEPYPYFSDYSDLATVGTGNDSNRIKNLDGDPRYWWLRSPNAGVSHCVRSVMTMGNVTYGNADGKYGVVVAANII